MYPLPKGRTGRYTLIEKWRDTERFLAPHESPVASLNTWGQYAGDVQLILHRTGPSLTERPPSEGPCSRLPERGLHRQSLPPMAKFRPQGSLSLRRREPRRKSLTFGGAPRSLRDILSGGRLPGGGGGGGGGGSEMELKRQAVMLSNGHVPTSTRLQLSGARPEDLTRLIRLQGEKLGILHCRLEACDVELRTWGERGECSGGGGGDAARMAVTAEEIARLESYLRRCKVEMEEEEFWASELEIERESERQLDDRLQELRGRVRECEDDLRERLMRLQSVEASMEAERVQIEEKELQQVGKT